MAFVELDEKGRCVIPKEIREKTGATKFEIIEYEPGRFVLVPVLPLKKLKGAFKTGATEREWKEFHEQFEKEFH